MKFKSICYRCCCWWW